MKQLSGRLAEDAASAWLSSRGFSVVARNWRTKICEIDIIARRGSCLYFVEVKYRRYDYQGDGFAYITKEKLWRMRRAAQLWVSRYSWTEEFCISAASVSGTDYKVSFIESIVS